MTSSGRVLYSEMRPNPSISRLLSRNTGHPGSHFALQMDNNTPEKCQMAAQPAAASLTVTGFLSVRVLLLSKSMTVWIRRVQKADDQWSSLEIEMSPFISFREEQTILLFWLDTNQGRTEVGKNLLSSSWMSWTPAKSKVLKALDRRVMSVIFHHYYLFDSLAIKPRICKCLMWPSAPLQLCFSYLSQSVKPR